MGKTYYIRMPDDVDAALEADKDRRERAAGAPLTATAVIIALLRKALGLKGA